MRLVSHRMLIGIILLTLPLVQVIRAHDCPLQHMGRLENFRALDKDKDLRLSLAEFMGQDWCREVPSCQCQETARNFFQRLDQNRDGFITLEEFQAKARGKEGAVR